MWPKAGVAGFVWGLEDSWLSEQAGGTHMTSLLGLYNKVFIGTVLMLVLLEFFNFRRKIGKTSASF